MWCTSHHLVQKDLILSFLLCKFLVPNLSLLCFCLLCGFFSYHFSFCFCQNQNSPSRQPLPAPVLLAPSHAFSLLILRVPVAEGAHIISLASIQLSQKRFSTDVVQMQNRFSKSEVHGVSETFPRASATLTLQLQRGPKSHL